MKKRLLFILILLGIGSGSKAQDTLVSAYKESVLFNVSATGFIRDAEYFLPFTKGYTMAGFRIAPTIQYLSPDKEFRMKVGTLLTEVAGMYGFWKMEPILSMEYWPSNHFGLVLGTLYGSDEHMLEAPLYDPERYYIDYKEDGLQVMVNTSHFLSDTWVNWEHFLKPWTPDQERFTLGTNNLLISFDRDPIRVSVPATFMGSHRGGQFTTLDTCIETLFNEMIGISLQFGSTELKANGFFFQNASPTPHTTFDKGWGLYPNLSHSFAIKMQNGPMLLGLTLGYWYGNQFQSARGSWLYQSVSWHNPDFAQPIRRMITAKLSLSQMINWVKNKAHPSWDLDAEAFYDIDLKKTDFAIGLKMHLDYSKKLW